MNDHCDEPATKRDLEELNQDLSAKIDANAEMISRVVATVVDNGEKLALLITKAQEFDGYFKRIMTTLDGLVADSARLDPLQGGIPRPLSRASHKAS